MDVVVVGAGPAGVLAALRAAELGARTVLVTRAEFGGMAANDGPVPVRTLAHAARLLRESRQLGRYGIAVSEPILEYPQLLARVREVVDDVRRHSTLREHIDRLGVTLHERAGTARFVDPHTIETETGLRLRADRIILCAGGLSRPLSVPGAEFTATHSDAWSLTAVPPSMLVVGAGATGVQVASIFNALGSRVAADGSVRNRNGTSAEPIRKPGSMRCSSTSRISAWLLFWIAFASAERRSPLLRSVRILAPHRRRGRRATAITFEA